AEGPRSSDDLARLWLALVDETEGTGMAEEVATPAPPEAEPAPEGPDDGIDLTDLVDAPTRDDDVVERLSEAFPGAELHTPEDSEP
ncbi:MAG: hypothetical protein GWN79_25355, partial [Actinobacteria bacterium]|nr:hypothetical protein [Actinomycetota bacterium]NIS36139.1 hypothetical protein [Actinomycetota bacterium]NIT98550.1 hypothetical protein [Actinomycetota bacterium]NIU22177.1 hypothetical protein [Actinomycetota bacterium]NIU70712.1 hypothetical protein [Actinomycetota bacterium]